MAVLTGPYHWVILHAFVVCGFFPTSTYLQNPFRNTIRVSNSLDPDQARHFVGPDLGPNCLQMLSAGDTSRQRVNNLSEQLIHGW